MKKKLLAILIMLVLVLGVTACGSSDSEPAEAPETSEAESSGDVNAKISAEDYDLESNYYFSTFNANSLADEERQGIVTYNSQDEVVYEDITYEEFVDLLQSEGTYIFTLAGSWCHNSRAMTPSLSALAKEYGVDTIYTYDYDLDDKADGNTFVRVSDGTENAGVNFNYMYGEVIDRYLTNMDDWVEFPSNTPPAITYTTSGGEQHTIARVQQPTVFVYNKDAEKPVLYAFEQMVDRDSEGVYVKEYDEEGNAVTDDDGNEIRNYITEQYEADLRKLFDYIKDNKVELTAYDEDAFMRKTFPALADAEKINVKPVTYRQYAWLLGQDGNAVYMVGGSYDKATQDSIAAVNAKAVEAGINVYLFDPAVDGQIPMDDWGYKNSGDITQSEAIGFMYDELISNSLTNFNADEVAGMPYVFAYNSAATDEDGVSAPIMAISTDPAAIDNVIEAYNNGI